VRGDRPLAAREELEGVQDVVADAGARVQVGSRTGRDAPVEGTRSVPDREDLEVGPKVNRR